MASKPAYDRTFKVLLLGEANVGKTTLANKYVSGRFLENTRLTVGVDFLNKGVTVEGKYINLQIWDFGGEPRFRFLLPTYSAGTDGAIFLYDVTNSKSLALLPDWTHVMKTTAGNIPIFLAGGKVDLESLRTVPAEEGQRAAHEHNLAGFLEVSSKTGQNVEEMFLAIAHLMLQRIFHR